MFKATGGGVEWSKNMLDYFKDLTEQSEMQKTASKNIIPSKSYEFLKIWVANKVQYSIRV